LKENPISDHRKAVGNFSDKLNYEHRKLIVSDKNETQLEKNSFKNIFAALIVVLLALIVAIVFYQKS